MSQRGLLSIGLMVVVAAALAGPAAAQQQCSKIADDAERLKCWDNVFPPDAAPNANSSPAATVPENGTFKSWRIETEMDAMTDKKNIYLVTPSKTHVPGRFSDNDFAQLFVQCKDETTSLVIYFGGAFVASSEYDRSGDITFRVDAGRPQTLGFRESTSNQHLGLWDGGSSIPVIKQMIGGSRFLIEATPYNENPIQLEFDLAGLDEAVRPLRSLCGW